MTSYGTIPTSSSPPTTTSPANFQYISRATDRLQAGLATRRPWREMFTLHLFSLPTSTSDAASRTKSNLSYFQTNYSIALLLILFLSLLYHPISLIVFLLAMVAWLVLYFLRDEPLVVFNRVIGDQTVLIGLGVFTFGLLMFTHATENILVAVVVGVVVVLVHAVMREMEYLDLDEEATGFLKAAVEARGNSAAS